MNSRLSRTPIPNAGDAFLEALADAVAAKVVAQIAPQIAEMAKPLPLARHPEQETWLDVRTACKRTGLGTTKVHELISSGALVSTKVGARRLIAASSIEALMRGPVS
jgi:excisionase family DNA binding protein